MGGPEQAGPDAKSTSVPPLRSAAAKRLRPSLPFAGAAGMCPRNRVGAQIQHARSRAEVDSNGMVLPRRNFLGLAAGASIATVASLGSIGRSFGETPPALRPVVPLPKVQLTTPPPMPTLDDDIRRAFVHNLHTGETLN